MNIALTPWFRLPWPAARRSAWTMPAAALAHSLDKGATLVVPEPRGVSVECRRGCLWLTHDGHGKDIVLSAGEHYVSALGRRLLVHALEDAVALVTCP